MSDRTVPVRLPVELLSWLDTIRFSEVSRVGKQWTSIPASQGETVEKILWEAHAKAQKASAPVQ